MFLVFFTDRGVALATILLALLRVAFYPCLFACYAMHAAVERCLTSGAIAMSPSRG